MLVRPSVFERGAYVTNQKPVFDTDIECGQLFVWSLKLLINIRNVQILKRTTNVSNLKIELQLHFLLIYFLFPWFNDIWFTIDP